MINSRKLILFTKKAFTYILLDRFDAASAIAYDTFTRANGAIGSTETTDGGGGSLSSYSWTGSTYTISSNTASNTPTTGSELLTDGALENWTSATNLTSWSESVSGTSTVNQETSVIHGGSNAVRLDIDASNNNAQISQTILSVGSWYLMEVWSKSSSGTPFISLGAGSAVALFAVNTTYTKYTGAVRADTTDFTFKRSSSANSLSLYGDDLSCKALTLSSLFASISSGVSDLFEASAAVTLASNSECPAGLVVNLDSTSSPQNFVIATVGGGTNNNLLKLEKCVGGTYTTVISSSPAYVAGATIKVVKNGTSYSLYYNGTQVGTTQTISDAGIVSKTLHGLFNTYSGNSLDNFNLSNSEVAPTRTSKPGPGTLTIVDTNSVISTSAGRMQFNGVPATNDGVITPSAQTRAAGLALMMMIPSVTTLVSSSIRFGWDANGLSQSGVDIGFDFASSSQIRIKSGASVIDTYNITAIGAGAEGNFAMIMRGTGGFFLYRSGSSGLWTIFWVYALLSSNELAKIWLGGSNEVLAVDDFRITQLPAPWTVANGIATVNSASPVANDTATATADGIFEFKWTVATGETFEYSIRRLTDNDRWIIRCSQAGSTIKLIEVVGGVETERASSAQTWTNATAYRIVILADTAVINNYVGLATTDALTAKNAYGSANTQQQTTGIKVAGFATGANLIAWPRRIYLPNV